MYAQPPRGQTIPPTAIPDGPPPMAPIPGADGGSGRTNAELLFPQQSPPGKVRSEYPPVPRPRGGAVLGEPDVAYPPPTPELEIGSSAEKPAPAGKADGVNQILDFAQVKDGVSAGRRPDLDGLDWLKAAGYKTVIFLRGRDDDDSTDRRQVEKRGMEFVGLFATPETLSQTWIDGFNVRVGETAARPIFVYSRDECVAGAVWYLHLRTAEFLTHDEARVPAARLGLKDEKSEVYRAALKALPPTP